MSALIHRIAPPPYPLHLPSRRALDTAIEALIELRNAIDGDTDAEDSTDCEDDFALTGYALAYAASEGPGCRIADPGGDEHDGREPEDGV